MQNFIVLGIIPGTNIQTDLNFWLGVYTLFALFLSRNFWRAQLGLLPLRFAAWRITYIILTSKMVMS